MSDWWCRQTPRWLQQSLPPDSHAFCDTVTFSVGTTWDLLVSNRVDKSDICIGYMCMVMLYKIIIPTFHGDTFPCWLWGTGSHTGKAHMVRIEGDLQLTASKKLKLSIQQSTQKWNAANNCTSTEADPTLVKSQLRLQDMEKKEPSYTVDWKTTAICSLIL